MRFSKASHATLAATNNTGIFAPPEMETFNFPKYDAFVPLEKNCFVPAESHTEPAAQSLRYQEYVAKMRQTEIQAEDSFLKGELLSELTTRIINVEKQLEILTNGFTDGEHLEEQYLAGHEMLYEITQAEMRLDELLLQAKAFTEANTFQSRPPRENTMELGLLCKRIELLEEQRKADAADIAHLESTIQQLSKQSLPLQPEFLNVPKPPDQGSEECGDVFFSLDSSDPNVDV